MPSSTNLVGVIRGGLGNQLFQLAAYLSIAHVSGRKLVLDVDWYCNQSSTDLNKRSFLLDKLEFENLTIKRSPTKASSYLKTQLLTGLRMIGDRAPLLLDTLGIISNEKFIRTKFERHKLQNVWLADGYFVNTIENSILLHGLRIIEERLESKISKVTPELAIHLRLGDYRDIAPQLIPKKESLFRTALLLGPNARVYSDEPAEARSYFKNYKDGVLDFEDSSDDAFSTLIKMASHEKFIGSYSTFSWWVARMITRRGGKVQFPELPDRKFSKISVPEDWTRY